MFKHPVHLETVKITDCEVILITLAELIWILDESRALCNHEPFLILNSLSD